MSAPQVQQSVRPTLQYQLTIQRHQTATKQVICLSTSRFQAALIQLDRTAYESHIVVVDTHLRNPCAKALPNCWSNALYPLNQLAVKGYTAHVMPRGLLTLMSTLLTIKKRVTNFCGSPVTFATCLES